MVVRGVIMSKQNMLRGVWSGVNLFDEVIIFGTTARIIGWFGRMYVLAVGDMVHEDYILADASDVGILI